MVAEVIKHLPDWINGLAQDNTAIVLLAVLGLAGLSTLLVAIALKLLRTLFSICLVMAGHLSLMPVSRPIRLLLAIA